MERKEIVMIFKKQMILKIYLSFAMAGCFSGLKFHVAKL